jgi:hypothetical protein
MSETDIEYIRRRGTMTASQLQRGRREIKTSDEANAILKHLVEAGKGTWSPFSTGRGRPTRYFTLTQRFSNEQL